MTGWPNPPVADATIGHNNPPAEVSVEATPETPEQFIARRDLEIKVWLNEKVGLAIAKEAEMEARKQVTATLFPEPKKGTQRYPLANGHSIKLVYTLRPTLGNKDLIDEQGVKVPVRQQVQDVEDKIIALGPLAAMLAERLIKWTPELSLSEFDKLDRSDPVQAEIATLIEDILTITPGSPALTFEEPKAGK